MKTILKISILCCLIIFLTVNSYSQVSPIPKFKGQLPQRVQSTKFGTYGIHFLSDASVKRYTNIITSKKSPNALDSSSDLRRFKRKLKKFDAEDQTRIFEVVLKLRSYNYKDTLLFTKDYHVVYLYSKRHRTIIKTSNSIDLLKSNTFLHTNKFLQIHKFTADSLQTSLSALRSSEIDTQIYKQKAAIIDTALKDTKIKIQHHSTMIDSIKDNIVLDMDFKKFSAPLTYSFYKTRRNTSKIFNNFYYGRSDVSVLQSLEINRSKDVTNFNTELANAFFRTFRISLAANINDADNDTSSVEEIKSDYQKLITNGGQFAFRIQSPVFFYHNSSDDIIFITNVLNRFGFDLIPDDPNTKNNNVNNFIGGDFSLFLRTDKNVFSFFAQIPFGYTFGNDKFYEGRTFKDFSTVQAILGVTIHDQFRIKFTGTMLSTQKKLQSAPWSIGFQFTPSISPKGN